MAQRTVKVLSDDIDGSELAEGSASTRFALDGVTYEIDLSEANNAALRDLLAVYIAAGRRLGQHRGLRRSG